jgi:predicted phage terminase large subunit-like protein
MATVKGHGACRGQRKGAIDGGRIWWIAPNYGIASDIWRDLKRACRDAWVVKNEVERRIELPGGGSVTVKSADNPDSLRGSGLDGVVVDEAATVDKLTWTEVLRPALADKRGWAIFIGTPKGNNWFRDLFNYAETDPDWERWQLPTSSNPLIDASELDAAERQMIPSAFLQEFRAIFIQDVGDLFVREKAIIIEDAPADLRPVRYWDKAGSTRTHGDYAVGVAIGRVKELTYILDVVRGRWNPFDRNRVIASTCELDDTRYGHGNWRLWIEQEPGNGGKESAMISARDLAKYAPRFEVPSKDKVTRAQGIAAQWLAGNVRIVRAAWNPASLIRAYTARRAAQSFHFVRV